MNAENFINGFDYVDIKEKPIIKNLLKSKEK